MTPATAGMPPALPKRKRIRSHPLLLDLGFTSAAQISLFVSNLLLVSLFARFLSATALAEYLLLRRVVAWLQSGVQLGLLVGIPRYVAHEAAGPDGQPETYFALGAACLATVALTLGIILNFWHLTFSRLLFGSSQMNYLILPLSLMVGGLALHDVARPEHAEDRERRHSKWLPNPDGQSAALVATDPRDGRVLAMFGGRNFHESQFNLAVQGERQPGSSFKPFALAAALQQGISPR